LANTDLELEPLIQGDKPAWDRFVAYASPIIFRAVHCSGGASLGGDGVADLVQDVFVRLCREQFRLLKTYDSKRAGLSTWLALVARSTTLDALRRRRPVTLPVDEIPEQPARPETPDPEPIPLPPGLLSERQELILRLLFERDMDVSQVAELLGIEAQTLRSTKHKALTKLRRYREQQEADP
jgi:RNA polymerase sigma-70 factor (ECF subfamily)